MSGVLLQAHKTFVRTLGVGPHAWLILGFTLSVVFFAACSGSIEGGVAGADPSLLGEPVETTRFARLTHSQWENTVKDLLYLDSLSGLSDSFSQDTFISFFDNNTAVLAVTPNLWGDYQRAAEDLAARVANDESLRSRILPTPWPSELNAQAAAFITSFGARAYRRPLTDEEIQSHTALFLQGNTLTGGADALASGIQVALELFLQSPHFLYRTELSANVVNSVVPLSAYEIASKLSYFFWNTMPDDELFKSAQSGSLNGLGEVQAQAKRLLNDARAHDVVKSFHSQLLDIDHYQSIYKDPKLFANYNADLNPLLASEALMFFESVVFQDEGTLSKVFTAPYSFVNAKTAPLYGLTGNFTDALVRTDLDPSQRSGFMTQLGFLADHSDANESNIIRRGVAVNRYLLCSTLPPPPAAVPELPALAPGQTNRERIETITGKGTCGAGCHGTIINPVGNTFEGYDALGVFRTTQAGKPVNTADSILIDDKQTMISGALELGRIMATSPQAHDCYTKNWTEYAMGRSMQAADQILVKALSQKLLQGESIQNLMLDLVNTRTFLARPATNGGTQ